MDRRLLLEFLPGIVLLLTNFFFDLFVATGAAILAAVIATGLRHRMDRQLPFIAIATVVLSVVLLAIGVAIDDERYIKMRATIGGAAFAVIVAIGGAFRPSLLRRSLDYKLTMTSTGWAVLHVAWIALAVMLAILNEIVWRSTSTETWVVFHAVSDPVIFLLYWLVTWRVAVRYWQGPG
ncbi:MAG: inner membrane-spanning protein YciB [Inquilinaceae bacterium]